MQFHKCLDYKLYSLGWRSCLHKNLSQTQHFLLSIFYLYRRGFSAGFQWIDEYYPNKQSNSQLDRTLDTF